jgi:hypothetical protein
MSAWPAAWHDLVEDELFAMYCWAFDQGVQAASAAMDRALDEALADAGLTAKVVVQTLVRNMDTEVARARP